MALICAGRDFEPGEDGAGLLADQLGPAGIAAGVVSDAVLAELYRGAVALVHLADHEGFGFTLLEALAVGTPVIASGIPVLRETLADHATFVDHDDPDAVARAIDRLLAGGNDPAERARRVNWARRYRWRRHAEDIAALYCEGASVRDSVIIVDAGDVLVRTVPNAHYRAIARHSRSDWRLVGHATGAAGIVPDFESGQLDAAQFVQALKDALRLPDLTGDQIRRAWCAIVGELDPLLARSLRLAAKRRLLLASNTNALHWRAVSRRLADAGIRAPACLSFEIGSAKPEDAFFATLIRQHLGTACCAAYVDDRADNVAAAAGHGLAAWRHTSSAATAARLAELM